MRCPTLAELPPPPPGKAGWPWTVESPQLPTTMPDGRPWARISIVTPSYNQGQFIEETIRSVLLQGYPNLEYIIVDGQSNDGSVELIRKYEPWLSRAIIEPDTGQPNAINKGFEHASGELLQWINSDDVLLPDALQTVGLFFEKVGDGLLAGNVINFGDGYEEKIIRNKNISAIGLLMGDRETCFHQPGLWFSAKTYRKLGGLDEKYQYAFDWHFLVRYLDMRPHVFYIDEELVMFRFHQQSKSISSEPNIHREREAAIRNLVSESLSVHTKSICRMRAAILDWWGYLEGLRRETASGEMRHIRAVCLIIFRTLLNPRLRLNRFTGGAIWSIIKSG